MEDIIADNNIATSEISNNIATENIERLKSTHDIENPPRVNKQNINLKIINKALEMVNIPNVNNKIKKR